MADGLEEFDAAVNSLKQRLMELGATPEQASRAAAEVASSPSPTTYRQTPEGALEIDIGAPGRLPRPTRVQPMDETGLRAGEFGLPPLSRNALAGPEMRSANTPMGDVLGAYDTGLGALASKAERGSGMLLRGAAEFTGVPQAIRAGEAVGEAALDPSLANVTNAGTQSALAVGRPLAAAGALGTGYLAAGAKDLGVFDIGANAQQAKAVLPGLEPEQQTEYNQIKDRIARGRYRTYAEMESDNARKRQLEELSNKFVSDNAASRRTLAEQAATKKQDEYDRAVRGAEDRLKEDKQRAKDQNFYETEVGKLYKKTGVVTPLVASTGVGAVSRAAGRPMSEAVVMGGLTGGMAANYPLLHNTYYQDAYNPEKAAYQAYARDLPPDHPRRAEWETYAKNLPDQNPSQRLASEQMWDPVQIMMRTGLGVAEGVLGGHFGHTGWQVPIHWAKTGAKKIADGAELAWNAARKPQLQNEASVLERNALAGPPATASAASAGRPASAATDVPLNPLGTGSMPAKPASAQPPPLPERQSLPPGSSTSQQTSEILKKVGFDKDGIPYWKEGHGRIRPSSKLTLEEREMLGIAPKKPGPKAPDNDNQ